MPLMFRDADDLIQLRLGRDDATQQLFSDDRCRALVWERFRGEYVVDDDRCRGPHVVSGRERSAGDDVPTHRLEVIRLYTKYCRLSEQRGIARRFLRSPTQIRVASVER